MKPSEMLFLGALSVLAGAMLIGSTHMPFTSGQTFGPGFLPLIASATVLVLCATLMVRGLRRTLSPAQRPDTRQGNVSVATAVALIAAATAAAGFGSVLAPLGLCMLVVTSLLLGRGWIVGAVSTLSTLAVIYAIFAMWLHIPIS